MADAVDLSPDAATDPAAAAAASSSPSDNGGGGGAAEASMEAGTYQLLHGRLHRAAAELSSRADDLNHRRLEAFGTSALELIGTERVRTEHNVVPRDVEAVGDQLMLAYNAADRRRGDLQPEDVFSIHHVSDHNGAVMLSPNPDGLRGSVLDDPEFSEDFLELHAFFKDSQVQQVYRSGQKLLAVFRTGSGQRDIRVLRWSIGPDHSLDYVDDRGERDYAFPPQQDLDWTTSTRADHEAARHVLIDERVVVDPLGGTLDIRLADDADDAQPLLSEPLDDADQSLQDCEIRYAVAPDLVLLRVLPYGESAARHYVVNLLVRTATRLDALGMAFRRLPEGHGLIFPDGIYLRTGEVRRFDVDPSNMELLDVVRSPNGEDVLHVFHERTDGRSILLPYNVVRQEVTTPIWCHGHCLFPDGTMIVFREEPEPTRVHPIQIWRTPFCTDEWYADRQRTDSPLDRIGNPDLVTGVADALALAALVADVEPSVEVYQDLLVSAGRLLDKHHWFGDEVVGDLASPVHDIRLVAESVIDEFEQIQEVRATAAARLAEAEAGLGRTRNEIRLSPPADTEVFIERLAELRHHLGHLHTVREQREIDVDRVDELIQEAADAHDTLALDAANHLGTEGAFTAYGEQLAEMESRLGGVDSSVQAAGLLDEVDQVGQAMEMVASTVGDLTVDDPRVRTRVLEQVSGVLAEVNRVRAAVDGRHRNLIEDETGDAFATEMGLFGQQIDTALARSNTVEECDDAMARLLLHLEQLESAPNRTDAQIEQLDDRRRQVIDAVGGRRQRLVDEQQARADRVVEVGTRTLDRMGERTADLESIDDVNGFFAADPMVDRVRGLVEELRELGEPVQADELQSRLGAAHDRAVRAVRDRLDLLEGEAVKLGRHRFSVDDRRRELTLVHTDDHLEAVLTGTDLRVPLDPAEFEPFRQCWDQPVPSETPDLYRALYLAGDILLTALDDDPDLVTALAGPSDEAASGDAASGADTALDVVRAELGRRRGEGYDRGVHDADACRLLRALAEKAAAARMLLALPADRSEAQLAWRFRLDDDGRNRWTDRGRAAAGLDAGRATRTRLADDLARELTLSGPQARYLLDELTTGETLEFVRSPAARELAAKLSADPAVEQAMAGIGHDWQVARSVLRDFVRRHATDDEHVVEEVIAELLAPDLPRRDVPVNLTVRVDGLAGNHPTVTDGRFEGRADVLLAAVAEHRRAVMPIHREYGAVRRRELTRLRAELRVDDLEPVVPEGFVRNQLIDRLYLPLIGNNLARQIGTTTDTTGARSGLLMLLSPPGYGKTTLVDYVAERLGMALVKVSGPGLGHEVTSLDPARAPSATAAREVERINTAFALGSNVMLYLDDIQHTSPELLQRFISLCDGQRRIEGVHQGAPRTFDLRGRRFAVVMAGNPYTESGERFRLPDMLANRADTYNLGDVVADNEALFAQSYLENALTSNPVLAPLAGRDRGDVEVFLRANADHPLDEARLSHGYSPAELSQILAVLGHLRRVQQVVLAVNRQYIASAATADQYRTEPPFLLQGSYRNMVRMAAQLLPAMTADEVEAVIDEHYQAESQALTGDAEANLLKLAELRGRLTDAQAVRWSEILDVFRRRQRLGGDDTDPTTRVVAAIEEVAQALSRGG